ncbi:hypothetical protein FACS1894166_09390 [Bacilli bacterium]|nr:hypothetical protein FACS1894166_09390 [Bacilli bacterium]
MKNKIPNESFFNEFVSTLKIYKIDNNHLYLECKNLFAKQTLDSDFKNIITKSMNDVLGSNIEPAFLVKGEEIQSFSAITSLPRANKNINSKYTFNNFIVSHFNKQAYTAAKSIFTKMF